MLRQQSVYWIRHVWLGSILAMGADGAAAQYELVGDLDVRPFAIVSFDAGVPAGPYDAVWTDGQRTPVQVSPDGRATMVLEAPGSRSFDLRPSTAHATAESMASPDGRVTFSVSGREVTTYHYGETRLPRADIDPIYRRAGYLHPVFTPGMKLVTDDYPPDHVHHHGIWAAWTRTVFQGRAPDFWNMGNGTGTVEVVGIDSVWDGAVHAGVRAHHRYVDLIADVSALEEAFEVRVYAGTGAVNMFDLTLTQRALDDTLHLSEYHYGGVGVRGHRSWTGEMGTEFLTPAGRTRVDGHATRARWCNIGGQVGGGSGGIAVLSHPGNREAPQPMRIHPTEPFFNFAPSQAGGFAIAPGEPTRWQYRFVTYDGAPDPGFLDALWADFARPLQVR